MGEIYTEVDTRDGLFMKDFSGGRAVRVNQGENGKPFQVIPGTMEDEGSRSRWRWRYETAGWEEARQILVDEGVSRPEERLESVGGVMEGHSYWFEVFCGDVYTGEVEEMVWHGADNPEEEFARVYLDQEGYGDTKLVEYHPGKQPAMCKPRTVVEWGYNWD